MHIAWLDACNGCVLRTTDTEVGWYGQREASFTKPYEWYLRRLIANILKVALELEEDVHAGELYIDGVGVERERAGRGSSERVAAAALWVQLGERLYIAMREKYSLKNMTRRPGAVSDCFVASCSRDERSFKMPKLVHR